MDVSDFMAAKWWKKDSLRGTTLREPQTKSLRPQMRTEVIDEASTLTFSGRTTPGESETSLFVPLTQRRNDHDM